MAAILFFTSELMALYWFKLPFLKCLAIIIPYGTSNHYLLKCKLLCTMMMMIMCHPQPITPGILFCHKQIISCRIYSQEGFNRLPSLFHTVTKNVKLRKKLL